MGRKIWRREVCSQTLALAGLELEGGHDRGRVLSPLKRQHYHTSVGRPDRFRSARHPTVRDTGDGVGTPPISSLHRTPNCSEKTGGRLQMARVLMIHLSTVTKKIIFRNTTLCNLFC